MIIRSTFYFVFSIHYHHLKVLSIVVAVNITFHSHRNKLKGFLPLGRPIRIRELRLFWKNLRTSAYPEKERQERRQESEVLREEKAQSAAGQPGCQKVSLRVELKPFSQHLTIHPSTVPRKCSLWQHEELAPCSFPYDRSSKIAMMAPT